MQRADKVDAEHREVATLLHARCLLYSGQYDRAEQIYRASLSSARDGRDRLAEAATLRGLSYVRLDLGAVDEVAELSEQAARIYQEMDPADLNVRFHLAATWHNLALMVCDLKEFTRAGEFYHRAIDMWAECDAYWFVAFSTHGLGDISLDQGDLSLAGTHYRRALAISTELWDRCQAHCLAGLACVSALDGKHARAGLLWAAVLTFESASGTRLNPSERQRYEHIIEAVANAPKFQRALDNEPHSLRSVVAEALTGENY